MSNISKKHTDYAFDAVPEEKRQNLYQLAIVWAGYVMTTSVMISGSVAGNSLPLGKALLAILFGNVILAAIGIMLSRAGCETNLSTYVLARYAMGINGAKLMSLVFIINGVGWYGVGIGLTAKVASTFIPVDDRIIAFVFAIVFMSTAMYGYKGLKLLSSIAVPFILIVSIVGMNKVIGDSNGISELLSIIPAEPRTFSFVVFMTVGTWINGAITAPDISRYAVNKKSAYAAVSIGFLVSCAMLMTIGAVLALSAGTWDLALILQNLGLGVLGLIFIIVIQWTTADNALYSSGLALANLFELKSKFWVTLGSGIVGTFLATLGIYNHIIGYILFLGAIIIPLAGIFIVDYQFFRDKYRISHELILTRISKPAMIAWVGGFVIAKFTTWGFPAINAILAAGILHYTLTRLMGDVQVSGSRGKEETAI